MSVCTSKSLTLLRQCSKFYIFGRTMFKWGQILRTVLGTRIRTLEDPYVTQILRNQCTTSDCMADGKFKLPARYGTGEKSVWVEYIQVVADYKPAVNLGQGFPDFEAPCHVTDNLANVAMSKNPLMQQYTRGFGYPKLVENLAKLYSPIMCRNIDPLNEILITVGGYEALYSAILGHVDAGDEVIIIEPFFDCYEPMIRGAGGITRFIPLRPKKSCDTISSSDWALDEKELTCLFNCRTKMIIVNNPHNPTGKVFTIEELQLIANLCNKYNTLCLADEVYEWVVYEPKRHIKMATLPGMWERTITIGSAGKAFSVTGWKTGWACASAAIMRNLQVVHQNCVYTCITPIQAALAGALEYQLSCLGTPECYFQTLPREFKPKRDIMLKILTNTGFIPTVPDGGYFILADWSKLANKIDLSTEKDKYKDYRFTKKFAKESGVLAIPPSAFYSQEHKHLGENFARFCYIKKNEVLALTTKLMKEWSTKHK